MHSPEDRDAMAPDASPLGLRRAKDLLALGLGPLAEETPLPPGARRGDYQIIRKIGRGATSFVYEARQIATDRAVALKDMINVDEATEVELQRFRNGAVTGLRLCHPNIVPVLGMSGPAEPPFFTMRLLERGPLTTCLGEFRTSPARAALLIGKIARAVHYAHLCGVVHRDLKPANILLDAAGEPYVADFGLSKRLDRESITNDSHALLGTLHYMAPEQAKGDARERPCAPDIFSLGVIFYQLLTGRVPYQGLEPIELLRRLDDSDPVPSPRAHAPDLGRSFENICLRCLEKDPAKRYRSAEELANDLESACGGGTIKAPVSRWVRSVRWVRRHRWISAALACALVGVLAVLGFGRVQQRRERDLLEKNAFMATGQAGVMLFQLLEYADHVERYAKDPDVRALFLRDSISKEAPELRERVGAFDTLFIVGADGYIRAQWPRPAEWVWSRRYNFRDYFRGAMELGRRGVPGAYVAPAFRSESHERLEFAISAPVRDANGVVLGIFAATLNASSAFGAVRLEDSEESGRITTALLGPRGVDRASRPSDFTFVVHPGMGHGAEYPLVASSASALRTAFGPPAPPGKQFVMRYVPSVKTNQHRDPIPGFSGPWLAAFAPVGATGFVVVVQTRCDEAWHRARLLAERFIVRGGTGALLLAAPLLLIPAVWLARRRTRRRIVGRRAPA